MVRVNFKDFPLKTSSAGGKTTHTSQSIKLLAVVGSILVVGLTAFFVLKSSQPLAYTTSVAGLTEARISGYSIQKDDAYDFGGVTNMITNPESNISEEPVPQKRDRPKVQSQNSQNRLVTITPTQVKSYRQNHQNSVSILAGTTLKSILNYEANSIDSQRAMATIKDSIKDLPEIKNSTAFGNVTFDPRTGKAQIRFHKIRTPSGRYINIKAHAISIDRKAGINGKIIKNSGDKVTKTIKDTALSLSNHSLLSNLYSDVAMPDTPAPKSDYIIIPEGTEFYILFNEDA